MALELARFCTVAVLMQKYFVAGQLTGTVTTLAGRSGYYGSTDGIGSNARFANPQHAAIEPSGTFAVIVRISAPRKF
jgi:hypothetical protein